MLNETGYGSASNGNMLDTGSYHIAFSLKIKKELFNRLPCSQCSGSGSASGSGIRRIRMFLGPLDPTGSGSTTWILSDTTDHYQTASLRP
jgi:hypothetical protein